MHTNCQTVYCRIDSFGQKELFWLIIYSTDSWIEMPHLTCMKMKWNLPEHLFTKSLKFKVKSVGPFGIFCLPTLSESLCINYLSRMFHIVWLVEVHFPSFSSRIMAFWGYSKGFQFLLVPKINHMPMQNKLSISLLPSTTVDFFWNLACSGWECFIACELLWTEVQLLLSWSEVRSLPDPVLQYQPFVYLSSKISKLFPWYSAFSPSLSTFQDSEGVMLKWYGKGLYRE